jgi:hypothetical protein
MVYLGAGAAGAAGTAWAFAGAALAFAGAAWAFADFTEPKKVVASVIIDDINALNDATGIKIFWFDAGGDPPL